MSIVVSERPHCLCAPRQYGTTEHARAGFGALFLSQKVEVQKVMVAPVSSLSGAGRRVKGIKAPFSEWPLIRVWRVV